jgi:phosphoserine aminotransferase
MTFYPGPSKVYPQVGQYLQDAFAEGILSVNHRSPECMQITRQAIEGLHQKLNIPADYHIYFISSATEAWEIIAQSLTRKKSVHYYNGAFGKKWAEYAQRLVLSIEEISFGINDLPVIDKNKTYNDVICITQNETSNGTQIRDLSPFRTAFPEAIIAVDVTSSLGGIELDYLQADVWFASVQKCLGLPAGMGLMICSPQAIERAEEINDRKYYNSLLFIHENFQKYQTHYTPNVLSIYLINKIISDISNISIISERIKRQAIDWYNFFENGRNESFGTVLVQNSLVRSDTVIAIGGTEEQIQTIKTLTKAQNITLGNGYGTWKNTSYRIANFPAIEDFEIEKLKEVLRKSITN